MKTKTRSFRKTEMNQILHIRMKNQLTWNYCHLFST